MSRMSVQRRFILAFLATLLIPTSILAHNGSVAVAVLLEGMVVDGDLCRLHVDSDARGGIPWSGW